MGAPSAKRRRAAETVIEPPPRVLTAAAQIIDPGDRLGAAKFRRYRQDWQRHAWDFSEVLGVIHFAHCDYYGNVVSRVRPYPGYQADPDDPPVPLDDIDSEDYEPPEGADVAVAQACLDELRRLDGSAEGGMSGVMGDFAVNLSLAGEGFLHGTELAESPTGYLFRVFSTEEFKVDGDSWSLHLDGASTATPILADDYVLRLYRRNRRYRNLADAPMRALLDDCDTLVLLKRVLRAVAGSRIHGGIYKIPQELVLPQRVTDVNEQGQPRDSPFLEQLEQALVTPITDPASPHSVVPVFMVGPADVLDHAGWEDIGRTYGAQVLDEIKSLTAHIAIGLDLPNEIVTGLVDANHWTAWQIDEETFKAHIEPLVQTICRGLTEGYLWPALRARGIDDVSKYVVWYDPSALIGHPNLFTNMQVMHAAYTVSDAALRRAGGASDEDEPDTEEIKERLFIEQQRKVTIRETGIAPPGELQPPSDLASTPASTTPPGTAPAPGARGAPAPPAQPALTAAGARGRDLGHTLMQLDHDLRLRVQTLADGALHRSLERAGAQIRRAANSSAQGRKAVRPFVDVAAAKLARRLGRDTVLSLGLDEDQLIDDELGDLEPQYDRHVKRTLLAALLAAGIDRHVAEQNVDASAPHIAAGFAVLAGAVVAAAHQRLFAEAPAPPARGEISAGAQVPIGVVRDSLAIAGGQSAIDAESRPAGVAVGPLVTDSLHDALGIFPQRFQWVYGYPDREFEPHYQLEGQEFDGWDDEVLRNDESFPAADFYHPGDHLGCLCDYIPMFESDRPADTEAPEEE